MLVVCLWTSEKHLILLTTILLSKLQNYGIRGIAKYWFEYYLTNRKQVIELGNTISEQRFITCGVRQGSILGPILFLLCINDIKTPPKF